jgi:transcriptional regulator with XRE-family HTH domain
MKRLRQAVNSYVTGPSHNGGMLEKEHKKNYIREWIKFRGLSMRKLEQRMLNEDGTPIISYASISRIAAGKQAYNQGTLEAMAYALSTTPGALLERHPERDAEIVDLLPYIDGDDRTALLKFAKSLAKKVS